MAVLPINETPYGFQLLPAKLEPKQPFLTVVVTGHFRLVPEGVCEVLPDDQQPGPGGAENYEDEIGNSRRLDGDMQPLKPATDCIFIGSAHAPGGHPVGALSVVFGVGPVRKALSVYGDRRWLRVRGDDVQLDGPDPFVEMPIRNEFAHGGHTSAYNKHGKGLAVLDGAAGSTVPVANIMPPDCSYHRWDEDAAPAGFGVLEPYLRPRFDLAGTYDETWRYTRDPLPPRDLDPRFFCGARLDQQVDGFLVGDEEMYFENLHPAHRAFAARLPGETVRIFVNRRVAPGETGLEFAEVVTHLDTCVVDMPNETVRLTWRGALHVAHDAFREIEHVLIVGEPVGARRDPADYAGILHARLDELFPPPPEAITEETRRQLDKLDAEGLRDIIKVLEEGGADSSLIAEVKTRKTVDEALSVMQAWLQAFTKTLPGAK